MSETIHPHDEQWDDMPLPDQEEAWQKMKLLLDKEEERRRFLPFWFWQYGLFGLLLLGVATGGYVLLNRDKKQPLANAPVKESTTPQQEKRTPETAHNKSGNEKERLRHVPVTGESEFNDNPENEFTNEPSEKSTVAAAGNADSANGKIFHQPARNTSANASEDGRINKSLKKKQLSQRNGSTILKQDFERKNLSAKTDAVGEETAKKSDEANVATGKRKPVIALAENDSQKASDRSRKLPDSLRIAPLKAAKDSINRKDSAKAVAAPPVVSNENKKEKAKKKNRIFWSAGLGLQQAIALNGQRSSSYNLEGKQAGLSDHLPSVYLRLQKESWFVQGEFHYNVPQPVEPFSFSQTSSYHTASAAASVERVTVQKLYYHQLPFSVNYFILPHWSLGVGGTYNLLAGAVTKEETESKNVTTGVETITTRIVPVKGYKDSFLYKSTAGILLQTDYHWKRISVGLRYTKSLQPFIKYTKPDGTVLDEKNQLLQAVLRFRIKG